MLLLYRHREAQRSPQRRVKIMKEKIFVMKIGTIYSAELFGSTNIADSAEDAARKVAKRYGVSNYEIMMC